MRDFLGFAFYHSLLFKIKNKKNPQKNLKGNKRQFLGKQMLSATFTRKLFLFTPQLAKPIPRRKSFCLELGCFCFLMKNLIVATSLVLCFQYQNELVSHCINDGVAEFWNKASDWEWFNDLSFKASLSIRSADCISHSCVLCHHPEAACDHKCFKRMFASWHFCIHG